ncbi:MAG: alpha/beta hydrolase [Moraxellaceae bacterium]|jgi:acetyl esterase/lipase|nr:alpha/beta hydrolase [Moraxellaceae bacterium]
MKRIPFPEGRLAAWLTVCLAVLLLAALPATARAGLWDGLQRLRPADNDASQTVTYTPPGWPTPLNGDLYLPPDSAALAAMRPVVLLLHGGAWRRGDKRSQKALALALAGHGYAALAINFRQAPAARHPAQLEDMRQALRWLRDHAEEYRLDITRIAAWGYSSGGHLAALLAVQPDSDLPRVRVVVAGGAPLDLRDPAGFDPVAVQALLGGTSRQVPALYAQASPMAQVRAGLPAFFLYHGTADELVPPALAERFASVLAEAGVPVELVWLEGLTHAGAAASAQARPLALDFLDHHFGLLREAPTLQTRGDTPSHMIRMSFPLPRDNAAMPLPGIRPQAETEPPADGVAPH